MVILTDDSQNNLSQALLIDKERLAQLNKSLTEITRGKKLSKSQMLKSIGSVCKNINELAFVCYSLGRFEEHSSSDKEEVGDMLKKLMKMAKGKLHKHLAVAVSWDAEENTIEISI